MNLCATVTSALLLSATLVSGQSITSVGDPYWGLLHLAPGSLASIEGANLGGTAANVTFNGSPMKILSTTGQTQLLVQIPVDATPGNAILEIKGTNSSTSESFTLSDYAPEFVPTAAGQTTAKAIHKSTGAAVTAANPALPGETISLFAIGMGPTKPVVPTGTAAADRNAVTATTPAISVGTSITLPATNVLAFLAVGQVGIYQIDLTLPGTLSGGSARISVLIGGTANRQTVFIPVGDAPVKSLANNYSYVLDGLPNYGIAQGAIFDIFGANLASTSTPLQSAPLKTSLAGVTVTATVNNTTTNVLLYYVTPNQIAGILPSNTPVGTGTLTVSNGGQAVGTTPIKVVQSGFGILTLNGLGTGQAAAFDVQNRYLGFTNALNPGEYVVLWGTGIGPVPPGTDESIQQTPADLASVPFQAWIGGQPATVYYHGRSQYPGLDQVILIVPPNVTPGCYVSVVGQSGTMVTNFATIPVAASGRTCSEPLLSLSSDQFDAIAAKGTFAGGIIGIDKTFATVAGAAVSSDIAGAQFFNTTAAQFNALPMPFASLGGCTVYAGGLPVGLAGNASIFGLNAGPSLSVSGPLGTGAVPVVNTVYKAQQKPLGGISTLGGAVSPAFIPASGGTFTFSNGSGTSSVGPFSASVTMGPAANFQWTNQASISKVNRANGLTVTWSGAAAGSVVMISGLSISAQFPAVGAQFLCTAPADAGTFTIPPAVLLSMPAAGNGQSAANSIQLTQALIGKPFTAPLLDAAVISAGITYMLPVTFQ